MAINKKLIHFKLKSSFETELANNNLLDTSIVFIQETKEIWTHGQLYKCSDPDLSNYVKESELQELLSPIQSSLANKLEASDLAGYAKTSDIPAVVTDSTVSNWGFMKTSDANETYAPKSLVETVSNQATTISTLATKDELSTGLSGKLDNSAASSFVPTTRTINGTALTDDIWITATDPNAATKDELNGLATTVANKAEVSALANFATTDALSSGLSGKQETLVSGTNIKTIEGKSILGSGDIQITAAEVGAYTTGQVDEKVTALNNAISGKVDPSTVNAVSDRVSALEGYFSTAEDSDATINKWGEIVNFLDGVAEGSNVEQLLAAKANQSALNDLSTTVSNVDAKFANYLPLSGGTIEGQVVFKGQNVSSPITINTMSPVETGLHVMNNLESKAWFGWHKDFGAYIYNSRNGLYLGIKDDGTPLFNNNTLLHSGNIGSYKAGDSDKLGGYSASDYAVRRSYPSTSDTNWSIPSGFYHTGGVTEGLPLSGVGHHVIHCNWDENAANQLFLAYDRDLLSFRRKHGNVWQSWKTIAFTDSNVASATKLATPRTIWGQSFDGTGDVGGDLHLNQSDIYWHYDKANFCIETVFHEDKSPSLKIAHYGGIELCTLGTERMRIVNNGNVLIGTTEDNGEKLQVNGDGYFSGQLNVSNINGYTPITSGNIGSQSVNYATTAGYATNAGHATTCADARCVVADNNATLPQGALLHSGINRRDDSTGDTWIYYDSLGGADAPWGIKHNQTENYIEFYGAGAPNSFINLSTGDHYAKGFVNTDYWSAEYALTSDGGVAHIPSMSVNYANTAGSAPASDVYSWAKKSSLEASDVPDLSGSYLSTSGGTLNGSLAINGYLNLKSHYIIASDNENAEWYVTDQGWHNAYTLIHSGNIGSQSVNYANSAGSATDQTARDAAATAQSTANGKWTWNASDVASVKVNNAGYADSAGSAPANGGNSDTLDNKHAVDFLQCITQNSTFSSVENISTDLTPGLHKIHIGGTEYSSILAGEDFTGSYWQMYFHPSSGYTQDIKYRATNCNWKTLLDSNNYTTYCTPANIGAAPASHTHSTSQITDFPSSLPANGGTADYASSATYDSNWNHIANTYATKGEIPSVGNGTVTITQNGTSKGSFTLNQSGNATIELTDTNTHPDLSGYATQSWVSSNFNYSTDSWRPVYDGVDSSATDTSASANAVRLAYGRADSAYNLAAGKQDAISDLSTIRSQASNGNTAYSWGNHASAGYLNTSSIVTDSGNTNVSSSAQPVEMMSFNGLITNGSVFSRNGSLYVADNPYMPASTHWLDVYSDPQSYGGVFYNGQITLDLYPDRFYDVTHNPLISTLTINSISGWNNIGLISHNIVRFRPGSSAFTLTLPSGIYWANGNPIECDDPDSIYEISFIKRSGGDEITATWTKFTQA